MEGRGGFSKRSLTVRETEDLSSRKRATLLLSLGELFKRKTIGANDNSVYRLSSLLKPSRCNYRLPRRDYRLLSLLITGLSPLRPVISSPQDGGNLPPHPPHSPRRKLPRLSFLAESNYVTMSIQNILDRAASIVNILIPRARNNILNNYHASLSRQEEDLYTSYEKRLGIFNELGIRMKLGEEESRGAISKSDE